jgi:hypothetical protein
MLRLAKRKKGYNLLQNWFVKGGFQRLGVKALNKFCILTQRGKNMATMTMPCTATAIEPKIKMAMENIGLGERADDLLDMLNEMELDRRLEISLAQAARGEGKPIEEFKKEQEQRFANGYFSKENAKKRIEERLNGRR